MELGDYVRVLRRRWISITLIAVAVTAVAAAFSALQTPLYASTARLFVTTAQTNDSALLQGGQFSAQRVKSYADLTRSRELAQVDAHLAGLVLNKVPAKSKTYGYGYAPEAGEIAAPDNVERDPSGA